MFSIQSLRQIVLNRKLAPKSHVEFQKAKPTFSLCEVTGWSDQYFSHSIHTRSSRARHGGPAGRAQLTQRSILKLPSLLIASIFPAVCLCASAWFDQLEVFPPKVTPIKSPVLYDSQTLSECQGPSGCDKPPTSPPNSTTKSGRDRLRSYKAISAALRKCPCGATNIFWKALHNDCHVSYL